jgi:hypothetical protein
VSSEYEDAVAVAVDGSCADGRDVLNFSFSWAMMIFYINPQLEDNGVWATKCAYRYKLQAVQEWHRDSVAGQVP